MHGIILTSPVGAGGGAGITPVEVTVPTSTTDTIDGDTFADCPVVRWLVSIRDTVTDDVHVMEVTAMHDFAGNVTYNCASIMGTSPGLISAVAGAGANEIELQVENTSATNTLDVCAFRMIQ